MQRIEERKLMEFSGKTVYERLARMTMKSADFRLDIALFEILFARRTKLYIIFLNLCINISVRLYLCVNRVGISGYFKRKLIELLRRIMKNSRDASDEIGRFLIGSFEINL